MGVFFGKQEKNLPAISAAVCLPGGRGDISIG